MYVDDGQLTDVQEARGSGQALIHTFFDELGTRLSADKREWMAKQGIFLGIAHDLTTLLEEHDISLWPKEALEAELRKYIKQFRSTRQCPPGDASKFRGIAGLAASAQYGQLGRAPMRTFKQRQYTDKPPWGLSQTMERAIDFIEMLLDLKLVRRVPVTHDSRKPLVIASDAQVEPGTYPGGGVPICDPEDGQRFGGYL